MDMYVALIFDLIYLIIIWENVENMFFLKFKPVIYTSICVTGMENEVFKPTL